MLRPASFHAPLSGARAGGFNGWKKQLPDARFPELAGFFTNESRAGDGSHDFGKHPHTANHRAIAFRAVAKERGQVYEAQCLRARQEYLPILWQGI